MSRAVAFYAPLKAPDHPNPSGDRRVARLMLHALDRAGWSPELASRLRAHEPHGDPAAQDRIFAESRAEAARLTATMREAPPTVWFTYHCYYKAPDLIGPEVARALAIPYVVAEGYRARKRLSGPHARFADAAERALDAASAIFHITGRGLEALERDRPGGQRLIHLPPFTALGAEPAARPAGGPLKLLTVAMMREGDKASSYAALAAALDGLGGDWRLDVIGDGAARAVIEARLRAAGGERVRILGRVDDRDALRAAYESADLFVWPGVNEGYGMVYLEAQAAGTPCVAEDRDGVREVVGPMGALTPPGDAAALRGAIRRLAADRAALAEAGAAARAHVKARHGINAAARTLNAALEPLAT